LRSDTNDAGALTSEFKGAESVFVLVPPNFDPSPDFHEARATPATLKSAIEAARPGRVVYLSTIGAQSQHKRSLEVARTPQEVLTPGGTKSLSEAEISSNQEVLCPCLP